MTAEVTHRLTVFMVDGERIDINRPTLLVESAPARDSVVLVIDGHSYTVIGRELATAISNCLNTNH